VAELAALPLGHIAERADPYLPWTISLHEWVSAPTTEQRTQTMLYVAIAYDGTEPGTFERRMQVRPAHIANGEKMMQDGSFLFGGAILDGYGKR
jgi:hypothetical protein